MYTINEKTITTKDGRQLQIQEFQGTGYLAKDTELKTTSSGKAVANGVIAINPKAGKDVKPEYFNLTAWEKTAEFFGPYGNSGRLVEIKGNIVFEDYTGKDGVVRQNKNVTINDFYWFGSGKKSDSPSNGAPIAKVDTSSYEDMTPVDDSDIPF